MRMGSAQPNRSTAANRRAWRSAQRDFFRDGWSRVGLGLTHSTVDITGSTRITPAGGVPVVLPGGNLALPTNIGSRSHDSFSWVPSSGSMSAINSPDNVRAFGGYTFLYWNDVSSDRGDQIDRVVNTTQSPVNLIGNGPVVGRGPSGSDLPRIGLLGPGLHHLACRPF